MVSADLFKALVWDVMVAAAVRQLFAAVPLLGWGPIGWVVSWIVMYFADKLFIVTKMAIDLEVIVIRNESYKKAYDQASVRLKLAARDHGIDSQEFRRIRDAHKKALSDFVRFGPR